MVRFGATDFLLTVPRRFFWYVFSLFVRRGFIFGVFFFFFFFFFFLFLFSPYCGASGRQCLVIVTFPFMCPNDAGLQCLPLNGHFATISLLEGIEKFLWIRLHQHLEKTNCC